MSALEKIRDIVAIIRDILIIVFLLGLIIGGLALMTMISQLLSGGLPLGLIGSLASGSGLSDLSPQQMQQLGGMVMSGQGKYEMDEITADLISELGDAFSSGDNQMVLNKLDELETHFHLNAWTDAEQLTAEIKNAYAQEDMITVQAKGMQLASLFKDADDALSDEAEKHGYAYPE